MAMTLLSLVYLSTGYFFLGSRMAHFDSRARWKLTKWHGKCLLTGQEIFTHIENKFDRLLNSKLSFRVYRWSSPPTNVTGGPPGRLALLPGSLDCCRLPALPPGACGRTEGPSSWLSYRWTHIFGLLFILFVCLAVCLTGVTPFPQLSTPTLRREPVPWTFPSRLLGPVGPGELGLDKVIGGDRRLLKLAN